MNIKIQWREMLISLHLVFSRHIFLISNNLNSCKCVVEIRKGRHFRNRLNFST